MGEGDGVGTTQTVEIPPLVIKFPPHFWIRRKEKENK